jgi:hypothetical protein
MVLLFYPSVNLILEENVVNFTLSAHLLWLDSISDFIFTLFRGEFE